MKLTYTVEEASAALAKPRSAIYDAIHSGQLESYKDGKRRLISRRALEAYVANKEAEAKSSRKAA